MTMSSSSSSSSPFNLILATRIHLGQQKEPTAQEKLNQIVLNFLQLADSCQALGSAIAVDANPNPKIPGYDLVHAVTVAVEYASQQLLLQKKSLQDQKQPCSPSDKRNDAMTTETTSQEQDMTTTIPIPTCEILPTTPWGQFVPALNALVRWGCTSCPPTTERIVFLSAETSVTASCIHELCRHVVLEDTLVAGAVLPGHEYHGVDLSSSSLNPTMEGTMVDLTGRTCPWNTLAVWNLKKLALTGFPLVADGLHPYEDGSSTSPAAAGIEEFSTILLHQKICIPPQTIKAKLVQLVCEGGLKWETESFENDLERKKWHEYKMMTKVTRAERHRELFGGLRGWVIHL